MRALNGNIIAKLKNNVEYRGKLVRFDSYMNILLEGAVETYNANPVANYGNVFIRGNNILYICVNPDELQ
jgi:U6 snRNA-associated Sm-like protein LSm6